MNKKTRSKKISKQSKNQSNKKDKITLDAFEHIRYTPGVILFIQFLCAVEIALNLIVFLDIDSTYLPTSYLLASNATTLFFLIFYSVFIYGIINKKIWGYYLGVLIFALASLTALLSSSFINLILNPIILYFLLVNKEYFNR